MALPAAYRKYSAVGDESDGQVFSVPFEVENKTDLYVYEGDDLMIEGSDYVLTGNGLSIAGAATGTVTITDLTEINNGDKVTLIATDTTSHDFTAGDVAGGGVWIAEIDNDTSAANLAAAIDGNTKFSASVSGAVVTISQTTGGTGGNTTIALTDSGDPGMSRVNFAGGSTSSGCTVTWVGRTDPVAYTFFRMSDRTQEVSLPTSASGDQIEQVVRRLSYQCQETIFATLEILNANGSRIGVLAAPIENEDIATHLYAQARYSTTGYLPPPVAGTDENKLLYAYDTNRVIWKDPFAVPIPVAADKILKEDQDGDVVWASEPTYAPTLPSIPSFLSTNAGGSSIEWRVVADLPPTETIGEEMSILAQAGDSVAWEEVEDLPTLPSVPAATSKNYILTLWSDTVDNNITPTTATVLPTKVTYIAERYATTNYGNDTAIKTGGTSGRASSILIEIDLTSEGLTSDDITYASLSLGKTGGTMVEGRTGTMCIGRLTQSWAEASVTYNTYDGSNAWPGGAGALNDIDYDMVVPPAFMKSAHPNDEPAGSYYPYDITGLVKDAIDNRSGVLSIHIFYKAAISPALSNNFASESIANPPKIDITHTSSSRQAKWLGVAWGVQSLVYDPAAAVPPEFDMDFLYSNGHDGSANSDHQQESHISFGNSETITHNLGFANLHGICFLQDLRTSADNRNDELYEFSLDVNSSSTEATVWWFNCGLNFFSNTSGLPAGAGVTTLDVAYIIWSHDTTLESTAGAGQSACG